MGGLEVQLNDGVIGLWPLDLGLTDGRDWIWKIAIAKGGRWQQLKNVISIGVRKRHPSDQQGNQQLGWDRRIAIGDCSWEAH